MAATETVESPSPPRSLRLEARGGLLLDARGGEIALIHDLRLGRAILRHLAGLERNREWKTHWRPSPPTVIRYWFDCWPPPWMGLTVAEELAFGGSDRKRWPDILARWRIDGLSWSQPTLELSRFDAVRLMLAKAELNGCELLLMEQPDAGFSRNERDRLFPLIDRWLMRSRALAVVTTPDPR